MLWCHGRGCKPPLTASHIHIGCIQSVLAPSYAVDGHMVTPLHCYTCAGGVGFFEKMWYESDVVVLWLSLQTICRQSADSMGPHLLQNAQA
jgi:hypothetical protein